MEGGRGGARRGHRVQERLEGVEVVPVDQEDVCRLATQLPYRLQPGKPDTDNDHTWPRSHAVGGRGSVYAVDAEDFRHGFSSW